MNLKEVSSTPGLIESIRDLMNRPEYEIMQKDDDDTAGMMAAKQLFRMIKGGNAKALEMLLDRIDGKVPQAVQANVKGDVTIKVVHFGDE